MWRIQSNHFSGIFYPKKRSFRIPDLMNPADILKNKIMMPRLKFLIPNLCSGATRSIRDFDLRLRGCGICASVIYFSNFFGKSWRKKTEETLNLILWFNLRLGGYSIWSTSTSRTIYDQDFGTWAPHSLEAIGSTWGTTRRIWRKAFLGGVYLKEVSEATRRTFWLLEVLEDARQSTQRLQNSATKSSGGLSDPG